MEILLLVCLCSGVDNVETVWASRIFMDVGGVVARYGNASGLFKDLGKPDTGMFTSKDSKWPTNYILQNFKVRQ